MKFFKQMLLAEHQKRAQAEITHTIAVINKVYNEWKFKKRRVNAVDVITTSINKIGNINPVMTDYIHAAAKAKLVIIIMRCLDNPVWKPLELKEKAYKKLYPLISKLQNETVNTGTQATLRDIIMTRMSAGISYQMTKCEVFVAYEAKLPSTYLRFLFGSTPPQKTYRMQSLKLPEEFESLIQILKINQEKAMKRYSGQL